MDYIAGLIDLLNDEEIEYEDNEERKYILTKLEEIYELDARKYSYYIYKDSEINKTDLYMCLGRFENLFRIAPNTYFNRLYFR